MGLSVAISGGIILTVFVLILFSLPGLADKMFSIGDITSQISQHEQQMAKTDISLETLFATNGSPYVNFTLNNDDREKLWNFEKFNVIVEYESASGDELEELSFSGNCLGALPAVGNWCIEGISGDFLDEGILNEGESTQIWTRVSQNLVNGNARVTVSTDNGEVAMLPAPKRSWSDAAPMPPVTCQFENYGRTFVDTDTGVSYICDPTRDKWLSLETITTLGEETDSCANGAAPVSGNCDIEWGNGLGGDGQLIGLYMPYNFTVVGYSFSADAHAACGGANSYSVEIWGSAVGTGEDAPQAFIADVAPGLIDDENGSGSINVDGQGNRFINYGLDNDCGIAIDDYSIMLQLKWRHDNP
jgi:hypothetical protein